MSTALTLPLVEAITLSERLMEARSMLPQGIRTAGEALAIIMAGAELGMPPMTSLREVVLIKGKVTLSAQSMLAFAKRDGCSHTWTHTDTERATITLQRGKDEPFTLTFSIEDAKRADLVRRNRDGGPGMWMKYPAAMLRARAVSAAIRAYCPDLLMGVYVQGEIPSEGGVYEPPPEPEPEPPQIEASEPYRWPSRDRKWFCASLNEEGLSYENVAGYCEAMAQAADRPPCRPSGMSRATLERLLERLQGDARAGLDEWLAAQAPEDTGRQPGDETDDDDSPF